jgi:nucleotide-binding universal stress UspA family protein
MAKPIVVGFHPRKGDHAPVRFGAEVARTTGARLLVVAVHPPKSAVMPAGVTPVPPVVVDVGGGMPDDCPQALEQIEPEIRAWRVRLDCLNLPGSNAARALHEEAERDGSGLLVVGSSSREDRVLGGSTADRLLHGAPCPVAVVPRNWTTDDGLHAIGVAYAGGEEGDDALRAAVALARRAHATLHVTSVVTAGAVEGLRSHVAELAGDVPVAVEVVEGDPAETLVRTSESLDVLVLGSRGYGPLRTVLLGDVSRRVTNEARCPVIVVPRGAKASLAELVAEAPAPV